MTRMGSNGLALARSLKVAPRQPTDDAAVALARQYAALLDANKESVEIMQKVGPRYLATLTALGLTPAGRHGDQGGGQPDADPAARRADEIAERRERRRRPG